jgi:UDP:flavonoid glycosyltransferase YjiC (YdhE family)
VRILIPTIGSRGDVQPFIALAQGLEQAGHTVTLASHPIMKTLVESYGVKFVPIGPDIDLAQEAADIRRRSRNPAVGLVRTMRFGLDMVERSHDDILAQCREADLVVISAQSAAGKNEADQLKTPYLSVTLMPWAIPWDDPERPLFKRMVYGAIDGLVNLITTRPLNRIRKRQGLPPVGKEGFTSTRLNLIPISPMIYAPNPHWEQRHRVVGYWFVEEPRDWEPPEDLLRFLEEGEAPLVISLGAMSLGEVDALKNARMFTEAIQQTGVRAVVQGWQSGFSQLSLPASIFVAGSLPHSWLLPHCVGLVHHGGFGTTSAGLRAGIPALVIPHIADQFYWGRRLYELGVAVSPIARAKLNTESLASGLEELARNEQLRTAADSLGRQISAEEGVENAITLIESTF